MSAGRDDVARRVAAALRERRGVLRLTQEAAAERSGLSVRYWRALEAAKPAVSMGVLDAVLRGLDWSWHDLADRIAIEEGRREFAIWLSAYALGDDDGDVP